jgi:hypothetical protein
MGARVVQAQIEGIEQLCQDSSNKEWQCLCTFFPEYIPGQTNVTSSDIPY